jgi:hypothetical protein
MAAKKNLLKFPLLRKAMLRPATATVKAQDELTALGLDGCLASRITSSTILSKGNYQKTTSSTIFRLTPTGILMEEVP